MIAVRPSLHALCLSPFSDFLLQASKFCQMWPWGSVSSAVNSEGHFSLCAIAGMFLLGHSKAAGGDSYRLGPAASTLSVDLCHPGALHLLLPLREANLRNTQCGSSVCPAWCAPSLRWTWEVMKEQPASAGTQWKLDMCSASSLVPVTKARGRHFAQGQLQLKAGLQLLEKERRLSFL